LRPLFQFAALGSYLCARACVKVIHAPSFHLPRSSPPSPHPGREVFSLLWSLFLLGATAFCRALCSSWWDFLSFPLVGFRASLSIITYVCFCCLSVFLQSFVFGVQSSPAPHASQFFRVIGFFGFASAAPFFVLLFFFLLELPPPDFRLLTVPFQD